jgi:hypothetical protein
MPASYNFPIRRLLCLALLCLCACAKTGDPEPPQLLVPRPALDLSARQYGDGVMLTVSPPTLNTNGSLVTTMGRVEVFRIAGDIRKDAGPLSEEKFLSQAEKIMTVPAGELAGYRWGGALAFTDHPDPDVRFTAGFRYAVRFINRRNQTAGLSNQAFVAPIPIPAAPEGLSYTLSPDRIRLAWKVPEKNEDGSIPARIAGFKVYRLDDPKALPVKALNDELLLQPEFEDRGFQFDKTYYYAVTTVGSREDPYAESFPSILLPVTPTDTFPPAMPADLTAVAENGIVTLLWHPSVDADLAGYRVYRRMEGSPGRMLLQEPLVLTLSFRDDQVIPGKFYEYQVVAVDTHGNESQAAARTVEVK